MSGLAGEALTPLFPVIKITGNKEGVESTPLAYTIKFGAVALKPT